MSKRINNCEGPSPEPFWYLLNQVMDAPGRELRSHSDNVRAPLQAIIYLTDEEVPVHVPATTETKTTN